MMRNYFELPYWNLLNQLDEFHRIRRNMNFHSQRPLMRYSRRSGVFPLVNITEDKDAYIIRAELPGVKSDDISIEAAEKTLSISGERRIPDESNDSKYHRRERESGKFSRLINLDKDINRDAVEASLKDGILTVTVPKAEKAKPKKITIHG